MNISTADLIRAARFSNAAYDDSNGLLKDPNLSGWQLLGSNELPRPVSVPDQAAWNRYFGEGIDSNFLFDNGNAQAFVARNGNTLAVAFRGSNSPYDFFVDLKDGISTFETEYKKFQYLNEAVQQYVEENNITKVLVTGYSLGAVIAEWFMADHHAPTGEVEYVGITFGSPSDRAVNSIDDIRLINFGHTGDAVVNAAVGAAGPRDVEVDLTNKIGFPQNLLGLAEFAVYYGLTWKLGIPDLAQHDLTSLYTSTAEAIALSPAFDQFIASPTTYRVMIGSDAAADELSGSDGADLLLGRIGDDKIAGGAGNDIIDGGNGTDTAIFQLASDSYEEIIGRHDDKVIVAGKAGFPQAASGTDTLYNVEFLKFADRTIDVFNDLPDLGDDSADHGSEIVPSNVLVSGLGGDFDYGEIIVPRNDDGSTEYDISSVFEVGLNFFGNSYTKLFVNTNGNITFGDGLDTFTPESITGNFGSPIIAPFWADVDTRDGALNSQRTDLS